MAGSTWRCALAAPRRVAGELGDVATKRPPSAAVHSDLSAAACSSGSKSFEEQARELQEQRRKGVTAGDDEDDEASRVAFGGAAVMDKDIYDNDRSS